MAEPDRVGSTGVGGSHLVMTLMVILLLAAAGLWRGDFGGSFRGEESIHLRPGLSPDEKMTAFVDGRDLPKAFRMYAELTGRELLSSATSWTHRLDRRLSGRLVRWGFVKPTAIPDTGICYHRDGRFSAIEMKQELEDLFQSVGLNPVAEGKQYYRLVRRSLDVDTRD